VATQAEAVFVDTRAGYAAGSGEILGGRSFARSRSPSVMIGRRSRPLSGMAHVVTCCVLCDVICQVRVPVSDKTPQDTHTQ
jgi:hypothetical protein